jgi:23S rRNA pseudouridine1911/1915/1917 synthase
MGRHRGSESIERNRSRMRVHLPEGTRPERLDDFIARCLCVSGADAADLIDFGSVQVGGRLERNPARMIHAGEEITVNRPRYGTRRHYEIDSRRIVYRDTTLVAYNKEAGVPSQQTPYDAYNNLFAALRRFLEAEGVSNPYVAMHHRLDQETSGIMVFALERKANRKLGSAFAGHEVVKDYLTWISGIPEQDFWVAHDDIGRKDGRYLACPRGQGKPAETAFHVVFRLEDRCLVRACPRTGRTHQIRLHLAAAGCPVVGDRRYGGAPAKRLLLHAVRIQFFHPISGKSLALTAAPPPGFAFPDSMTLTDALRVMQEFDDRG